MGKNVFVKEGDPDFEERYNEVKEIIDQALKIFIGTALRVVSLRDFNRITALGKIIAIAGIEIYKLLSDDWSSDRYNLDKNDRILYKSNLKKGSEEMAEENQEETAEENQEETAEKPKNINWQKEMWDRISEDLGGNSEDLGNN